MMESSELFSSLTIDDVFMVVLTAITVVLTGIIAWSVRSQAKYTKQLADDTKQLTDISIQAEKRAREQNKPKVKFTSHSSIGRTVLTSALTLSKLETRQQDGEALPGSAMVSLKRPYLQPTSA